MGLKSHQLPAIADRVVRTKDYLDEETASCRRRSRGVNRPCPDCGSDNVVRLLFGADVAGIGLVTSQFAGLALLSLGVACWSRESAASALYGMLTYSSLATLGLLYLALGGKWNGPLLWPAVVLHAVLTLLTWAWSSRNRID